MGKGQLFRVLLPFSRKVDLCIYRHGIIPCINSAFYCSSIVTGTRFCTGLVERGPDAVEGDVRPPTAEEVLRRWGCDDTHVATIFQRLPSVRNCVAKKLESKLSVLKKLGVSSSDLVKMIITRPRFMSCQINKNFDEKLGLLESLFGSRELLIKVIVRNPSLLIYKFHEEVEPVFRLYEQMGLSKQELISMLVHRPTLIARTKMCEEKLDFIRRTGITKESKMFKYVVTIIGVSRFATIHEKVANLEKFGISEDEVLQLFGRCPLMMTLSVDKIQRNMTFVVGMMKQPAITVLRYPYLLSANLENTLKPRYLLAGKIQDMGLEPQMKGQVLFRALRMTEKRFLKVFVKSHEKEARQELLAYYKASQGIKRLAASSRKKSFTCGFPF